MTEVNFNVMCMTKLKQKETEAIKMNLFLKLEIYPIFLIQIFSIHFLNVQQPIYMLITSLKNDNYNLNKLGRGSNGSKRYKQNVGPIISQW